MPVPILLIAGFLGAGKTTVVNHLLAHAEGRRIAAVVNDFGAINIDAELIAGASDGVVSLANGCICCSLEGDLLRTLATILRRTPRPEAIVIETSGIADPTDIVRNLMDPVIWREAPLETVLCVVDSAAPAQSFNDALFRAQLKAADVVALTKGDLTDAAGQARIRAAIAAFKPAATVIDAPHGRIETALLFPADPDHPPRAAQVRSPPPVGGPVRNAELDFRPPARAAPPAIRHRPTRAQTLPRQRPVRGCRPTGPPIPLPTRRWPRGFGPLRRPPARRAPCADGVHRRNRCAFGGAEIGVIMEGCVDQGSALVPPEDSRPLDT